MKTSEEILERLREDKEGLESEMLKLTSDGKRPVLTPLNFEEVSDIVEKIEDLEDLIKFIEGGDE